ncbi:MAG: hypothetical protein LRY69_07335 [Gammaproteobacteria bacterium]|nr:hypothetical protein [Gammaproteobacteria bacterium]
MMTWFTKKPTNGSDSSDNAKTVQNGINELNTVLEDIKPIYDLAFYSVWCNPDFFGLVFDERPDFFTFFTGKKQRSDPYGDLLNSELIENNSENRIDSSFKAFARRL